MLARLPRWTSLLALPMLVGALLLMHGLDAHARGSHPGGASVSATTVEEHAHGESTRTDHAHCGECLAGHLLAACVAIITAIGSVGRARHLLSRWSLAAPAAAVSDRLRGLVTLARPPDPPWVRLSVMRC